MQTHKERLILLNLIPDVGSIRLRRMLDAFGDLDKLYAASERELCQVEWIGLGIAGRIVAGRQNEQLLEHELSCAKHEGVMIVTLEDSDYPQVLREIPDPPLALYIKGKLPIADEIMVAIVGSRRASTYGLQMAQRLAYDLALRGVVIVSGLARGIDGAAHKGALKAKGKTIAVLGCGLSKMYPPEHGDLAKQIIEEGGAVISEYPMQMAPMAQNFPRRNRIISGLSRGVVIVEAAHRSGALITADCALEQGREVFAVPGPVTMPTSEGTHGLLKQGAWLVSSVEDIVDELDLDSQAVSSTRPASTQANPVQRLGLTETERDIISCLGKDEASEMDVIAQETGFDASVISSTLLKLELNRFVKQLPGKRFVRCPYSAKPSEALAEKA